MTLYNALSRKEYERVFMCKIEKEIWNTLTITHQDYSNKNHVRKFFCALPLKWRPNVMAIEEAKDLAELPFDELIGNLKVYEMVLENDGVVSNNTKEKALTLQAELASTVETLTGSINNLHW
nr:hypothetical protein [Tanacetum cinerariifolium]